MKLVANHKYGQTILAVIIDKKVWVTENLYGWRTDNQIVVNTFDEGLPNIEATLAKLNAFFAAEEAEKASSEALLNRFANHFVPTVEEAVQ